MPNWCEGNLRLRGTGTAILEFVKNEFAFAWHEKGMSILDAPKCCSPENVYDGEEVFITVPECAKNHMLLSLYVKGTRRNFIESKQIYFYLGEEENLEKVRTVCIDDFKAAWGVDAAPYVEKAKKYGLDIKIIGFERGMQFAQYIEIVNGELIKNNEIKFDDWDWECIMPNMGG